MGRYMGHKCYSYYSILINAIKFYISSFLIVYFINKKLKTIICDLLINIIYKICDISIQ